MWLSLKSKERVGKSEKRTSRSSKSDVPKKKERKGEAISPAALLVSEDSGNSNGRTREERGRP